MEYEKATGTDPVEHHVCTLCNKIKEMFSLVTLRPPTIAKRIQQQIKIVEEKGNPLLFKLLDISGTWPATCTILHGHFMI